MYLPPLRDPELEGFRTAMSFHAVLAFFLRRSERERERERENGASRIGIFSFFSFFFFLEQLLECKCFI